MSKGWSNPQLTELAERCRSLGFVLMPVAPDDDAIETLSRYTFQVPDGRWEDARKDAIDAYGSLVAVAQL